MTVLSRGPSALEAWQAAAHEFGSRARETEQLGRLADETAARLKELGVPRMLLPRRWGGEERDLQEVLDMAVTLARGCMSSAWCAAIWAEHPWVLCHFDERFQAEVWRDGPDEIVCMAIMGASTIREAKGGYEVEGQWRFVSGCDHASWFLFIGGWEAVDGQEPRPRLFAFPRQDVAIDHDSWNVAGLRGTGSKTVSVSRTFVPEHRVLDLAQRPGPGITPDMPPLFHQPIPATLGHALAAVSVGGAEAAFDLFLENTRLRVLRPTGTVQAADPSAHLDVADAIARIDSAKLLLRHNADVARASGRPEGELPATEMAKLRMYKGHIVREAVAAVDRLFAASGGGALQETNPLQRIWRDVHAVQAHAGLTWANGARNYGALAVGLPPTNKQLF
ncbi:MAG TPA: acyl-CoA dehydrogenase family protein [Chloroflexota bacterium]|nr:acyl-CoA dehydrogenase family protein [Chloroflexota bacterium]